MKRKYILPVLLLLQIVLLKVLAFFPETVESFYSNGLFVCISKTSRTLSGGLPFSVGDVLYGFAIVYLMVKTWRTRKSWRLGWKDNLLGIVSAFSIFYFLFHLLWALNYYRQPLFEKMHLKKEYTQQELIDFTQKLVAKTNQVHWKITGNKSQKVVNPYSQDSIFAMTQNGYDHLAKIYPYFDYEIPSRKKSLFSLPLTYMGFGGYLNPFTNEAQVNDKLPMYGFSNVICHEMAHQIGYASESECNFIGFMAGVKNDDLYFQYAAYSNALRYCLNNIAATGDLKLFSLLKHKVNPGILENYKESEAFWKQYDTFIDQGFHTFYDQYLKANQQEDGIDSYSKFVGLLVNYYRDSGFLLCEFSLKTD